MFQGKPTRRSSSSYSEHHEEPNTFLDTLQDEFASFGSSCQNLEMNTVAVVPDDTFTVTQAVNALGFGKFQAKLSLFTGLCWMTDSMEMTILSILAPALHCEWNISCYQQALFTTMVFMGMMLSSTFWAYVSDKYGRKKALLLCAYLLLYYGALSSLSPNYMWILILRGIAGFAIGCIPQSVTLYSEFLPTMQRAKCVVLLDCFWALGACFEVVLALLIMPTMGRQWLLFLSTAPILAFTFISSFLPESARYHVASGEPEKALETLQRIASENNKPMPTGRLVVDDAAVQEKQGRALDLLIPQLRRTSVLLWVIWTACAFCYYGVVLMTTGLIIKSHGQCQINDDPNATISNCMADCTNLNTQDYMDLLWTTFAEFPGIFVTIFIIERFGRKITMAVQFTMFSICLAILYFCSENRIYLTTTLFFARGIIAGVFQAAYVYTPEVYPAGLRSVGVGTCSGMARFGAMLTPYIAQVLFQSSLSSTVAVYSSVSLAAAIACSFLPTKSHTDGDY
ncbi:unnamed protein product [Nezara viridula]|uniref:Major facilitator superfamily (MFS) profile domain-containing protein n=1 Tax=Nezara viridula TaxID=85310 RepID=A0A9P0EBF7_NEZVI|nr:unnamed protein product [Nezara viridula]